MLDVLQTYLDDAATPEMRDSLVAAHNTLERVGLSNYEQGFEELLMIDGDTDHGGTIDSICELTKQLLFQALKQHTVLLTTEATVDTAVMFVNGILDLQDYSDIHTVYNIANQPGLPEEVFAELMRLVTPKNTDELLYEIQSVNALLIDRVKEMASPLSGEDPDTDHLIWEQKHITYLNRFLILAGTDQLHVIKAIKEDGLNVGYPFAVYIKLLGRDLENMSPAQAARELLAMAYISSDGMETPQIVIKANVDNYISHIDAITKIDIEIGKLLLGMQL
jgi:hypothetical protein